MAFQREESGPVVPRVETALVVGCKTNPVIAPAGSCRHRHGGNERADSFGSACRESTAADGPSNAMGQLAVRPHWFAPRLGSGAAGANDAVAYRSAPAWKVWFAAR